MVSVKHIHPGVDLGTATATGNRYCGLQQDYICVQEFYTKEEIPHGHEQIFIAAVCDGHGILGDKSAAYAGKALCRHLYSSTLRNKRLSALPELEIMTHMRDAFHAGHHAAMSLYDHPPGRTAYATHGMKAPQEFDLIKGEEGGFLYKPTTGHGHDKKLECGCTATAAIIQGRTVSIANVGDSAAFVGGGGGSALPCHSLPITIRHHGLNEEEADRIRQGYSGNTQVLHDGYISVLEGIWLGYQLSVTRALGHRFMEKHGVLSEPHVQCFKAREDDRCMVIASDGVWDAMDGAEAVRRVMCSLEKGLTATQAASQLVQDAVALSLAQEQGEADNTSAIVIFFQ